MQGLYRKRWPSVAVLLVKPTGFFAGEAVPAVIGDQTLLGRSGTCQRIQQRVNAVGPAELRRLLQVAETELRQTSAQLKHSLGFSFT